MNKSSILSAHNGSTNGVTHFLYICKLTLAFIALQTQLVLNNH